MLKAGGQSLLAGSMLAVDEGWSSRHTLCAISLVYIQKEVEMALQRVWLVLSLGMRQLVQ